MPQASLSKVFHFSASHFLTKYHGKCEKLHGHNYKLIVTIKGKIEKDDMVIDFKEIKKIVTEKVIRKLDHTHLNDLLENPSIETLCIWIWKNLAPDLPLKKITLFETENSYCEYYGE